jgi:hypothetical protein
VPVERQPCPGEDARQRRVQLNRRRRVSDPTANVIDEAVVEVERSVEVGLGGPFGQARLGCRDPLAQLVGLGLDPA